MWRPPLDIDDVCDPADLAPISDDAIAALVDSVMAEDRSRLNDIEAGLRRDGAFRAWCQREADDRDDECGRAH